MFLFKEYLPFYKRNLVLAAPVMVAQAGQVTVQFADNIMVGHLGTTQFAGVAFANTIFLIGFVFAISFTQGLTPHAGQNYGKGDYANVAKFFFNSFVLDFIMVIAVMALLFATVPFMYNMGQDEEIVEYAITYLSINILSLIPGVFFFAIRNFSEGIGITKYAMYITIFSNIVNILLNWMLIYGKCGFPSYGVAGAAYATLISRILAFISFAILIITIEPYKSYFKYLTKDVLETKQIKELLSTSVPIGIQGLVEVTAFSLSGIMSGWFGKVALAGHQIANTMGTTSFMIAQGIGAAATIRVSHQVGAKDYIAAKMAAKAAIHMSVAFMGMAGIIYVIFRHQLPLIFTSDPQVIDMAATLLIFASAFQVFDAAQLSGIASLRALNDVKIPLLLSFISFYCICLPLGYLCSKMLGLGPVGVWTGLILGLMFAAVLYLSRFNKLINRYITGK